MKPPMAATFRPGRLRLRLACLLLVGTVAAPVTAQGLSAAAPSTVASAGPTRSYSGALVADLPVSGSLNSFA